MPDQNHEMVAETFDDGTAKSRKRRFCSDTPGGYDAQAGGPASAALFRSSVMRAFFVANGRRLPPERPYWR